METSETERRKTLEVLNKFKEMEERYKGTPDRLLLIYTADSLKMRKSEVEEILQVAEEQGEI